MFRPSLRVYASILRYQSYPKTAEDIPSSHSQGSPHTPEHGLPWPLNIDTFTAAPLPSSSSSSAPPPPLPGQTAPPLPRKRDLGRAEERKGGSWDPLQRGPLPFPGIEGVCPPLLAREARVIVPAWLKGAIIPPPAGQGCAHFPPNWKCRGRLMGSGC